MIFTGLIQGDSHKSLLMAQPITFRHLGFLYWFFSLLLVLLWPVFIMLIISRDTFTHLISAFGTDPLQESNLPFALSVLYGYVALLSIMFGKFYIQFFFSKYVLMIFKHNLRLPHISSSKNSSASADSATDVIIGCISDWIVWKNSYAANQWQYLCLELHNIQSQFMSIVCFISIEQSTYLNFKSG